MVLVTLLAVLSAVVGVTSVLALRHNLLERLDDQVRVALVQLGPRPGGVIREAEGRIGTVEFRIRNGAMERAHYIDDDGERVTLDAAQRALLARLDLEPGEPRTVDLGGEIGAVRVAAGFPGDGTDTVVAGIRLAEVDTTTAALALIFGLVTLAALAAAALVGTRAVEVALRPLGRVTATARRVAELPLARGEVTLADRVPEGDTDARTEVGQVGAAFNRMLGHVEEALHARQLSEEKVRQFVADASHELRTPLASIRGYSEFTRRSGHALPADIVHALERIESESVRMTSLVEDLLLLARLDAGQEDAGRRIVGAEVDLVGLLADAVSDAHAASPEHEWRVELPSDPVLVTGDRHRLQQVIVNLLANARIHTPAGTTVVAGVRRDDDEAVVTVDDDGPGIPDELLPTLFERFVRGDGSRSRQAGSTGLGLAIVAAVVQAHDGTVTATSLPGRTRFEVRLAAAIPAGT